MPPRSGPFAMLLVAHRDRPGRAARGGRTRASARAARQSARPERRGPDTPTAARSCWCNANCSSTRAGCRRDPAGAAGRVRRVLRVSARVRPACGAGLGRQHDAHRIRGADRHPRERTRLRPLQSRITRWPGRRSTRRSGGCAGPATARSACTRSTAAFSAATWRCRRSASSAFSAARRSAARGGRPIIRPGSGRATSCGSLDARGAARPSSSRSRWAITARGSPSGPPIDPAMSPPCSTPAAIRDGAGLLRYLDGLRRSDEMLQILIGGLERARQTGACSAFTATICRACRSAFAHFGFAEPHERLRDLAGGRRAAAPRRSAGPRPRPTSSWTTS